MIKNMGNSVYYLAHVGLGGVLAIALMSIIANKLSTDELGWFVLAQTYSLVFTGMANLGVLVGYERNFFVYEKSPSDTAQLFSSAVLFVTFNLLVLIVFIYIFRFDITQAIIAKQASTQLLFLVLCGSAISSIIQYYLTFLKNSSLAKRFFQFAILQILLNFSISMFLLFTTNLKSLSLAYAWLFSNATVLILLVFSHKKLLAKFNKTLFKEVLRISLPLTPRVFFGFINTQLDKIMLGLIATTGSVAIYNIGQLIAQTIFQFMTALGRVFQPEVYRKLFAKEQDNLLEINNYILPFFYVSILIALLVALFSKEFVGLFFPIEYSQATLIVLILSIYYASLFFGKITGNQLIYAKKTHITSLLMLIGVTLNVSLNFVFIKNFKKSSE